MVTFSPCIRSIRADGYAKVYIRITNNGVADYIGTDLVVSGDQIEGKKLKDSPIKTEALIIIKGYVERLNKVKASTWPTKDLSAYLLSYGAEISFSEYYDSYVADMVNKGRGVASENYKFAHRSLLAFSGKKALNFSDVTSKLLNAWIIDLSHTRRAKNMYPTCIQTVFNSGLIKYNDYDNDDIRIKNLPFMRVKIPKNDRPKKRSVKKDVLLSLFNVDVAETALKRTKIAKDVALMVFCLAGINVADLYYMDRHCRRGNVLCYCRHKTKKGRDDEAYIEIAIPDKIRPLFDKYKGTRRLLSFSELIKTEKAFLDMVDIGLKDLAKLADVSDRVSTYTFRHSFATIAQNQCGASDELVGFALNHTSAHKVTNGYIEKDFTVIDKLNDKVMKYVFGKLQSAPILQ